MTLFFVLSALLVALTLAVLGWSVLRAPADGAASAVASDDQREANIAIAREQLAALDRARDAGDVDAPSYAEERDRLERALAGSLDDVRATRPHRAAAIGVAALVAIGVPVATGVLYLQVGQPDALVLGPESRGAGTAQASGTANGAAPGAGADGRSAPALAELLPELEAKLAERPDDLEGWRLLGRTYLNVEEFDKAASALARARELAPNDPDVLTALGEARAMRAGGTLLGDALEPLEAALRVAPMHEQTLWLLGIARQQAGRHDDAIELLTRLRGIAVGAGNAQAVSTIDDYLSVSREAIGMAPVAPGGIDAQAGVPEASADPEGEARPGPGPTQAVTAPAGPTEGSTGAEPGGDAAVTVTVSLSDGAAAATTPDQAVFVFARAADGPPMPLAVARLSVADLPTTVTLDDSMAMLPTMTLGTFPEVVVGARVSSTGQPAATPGDWFDEEDGVEPSDAPALELVIDRQVP